MALLTPDNLSSARRGDWINYGAFREQLGSGKFLVPHDGFETDDRGELNMHILNLVLCHNDGPTPVGPPIADKSWEEKKFRDETACPEDMAHLLTYSPDAVFCIYGPKYGPGLRFWALKLKSGGMWPAFAILTFIEETEPRIAESTRVGTISGILLGNIELMGGLKGLL